MTSASAFASASAWPAGTSRLARPQSNASRAPTSRPVRIMSSARLVADQARQAHRAAVDQRHAPAPAEHAELRRLRRRRAGRTTARAPARPQRHSPRPRRSPAWRADAASAPSGPAPSASRSGRRCAAPTAFRSAPAQNVPPRPVRIATDCASSVSKARKASRSSAGGLGIDRVARLGEAVDRDDGDRAFFLDRDLGHAQRPCIMRSGV